MALQAYMLRGSLAKNLVRTSRTFCSKSSGEDDKSNAIIKAREQRAKLQNETPSEKSLRILKNDFSSLMKGQFKPPEPKVPKRVDFLIIGGGVIGSSIAYWMKHRAPEMFDIMVVERDPKYTRASTTLSVGGIRQQFSIPENIKLAMYSAEFLRNIKEHLSVLDDDPPDVRFQPHGYLFLASEAGVEQMMENYAVQKECSARVELLRPRELSTRFPWLNLDGIVMGSYGMENEGWFDPWSLLSAFKKKACSLGTKYVHGEVIGFELERVPLEAVTSPDTPHLTAHYAYVRDECGEVHIVEFAACVVAAGAFSNEIAKMLHLGNGPGLLKQPFTVEPRKRYVYTFCCDDGPGIDMPLIVDPSGAYIRREGLGGKYICGRSPSPSEEPDIENLDVDYSFFDNSVWPIIAQRVPAFEAIKICGGWAGYYDYNTLDQNPFFGKHPFYDNFFFATGFSGHGIQMAPAIGRAASEYLMDGTFHTIDLSCFSFNRLYAQRPLLEKLIV